MRLWIRQAVVRTFATIWCLACVSAAEGAQGGAAAAQSASAAESVIIAALATYNVKNVEVDLTVPESPAFTALGLNPETIVRPATPREFATALLNGVDQQGNLQTGVAFDLVPYLVFGGTNVMLSDYRSSTVTRILSRTSVSVATTTGAAEDDKSVKLAYGAHTVLYDSADPRMNNNELLRCFSSIPVFRPTASLLEPAALERERAAFEQDILRPRAALCREDFRRTARWSRTSWTLAYAGTNVSPSGLAGDLTGGAKTFWTSLSYGFDRIPGLENRAQLVAHVRHVADEIVVDKELPSGQEVRDTTIAGTQFRGGTTSFALALEAAYVRSAAARRTDDTAMRLTFSAERRLAQDVWLTVSFGGDRGADEGTNKGLTVLSALTLGFSKDPSLTLPPQ